MSRTTTAFSQVALVILAVVPVARADVPAASKGNAAAIQALERHIRREITDKQIPALSIALVEDQAIVWSAGFGFTDPKARTPATAESVYRVGSVSKLFTDIAVMQLVEQGKLDLDAPVTNYLPDFQPVNPFGKPITLRQLMAHRSGLVREPPVGNYFDPTTPSLARSVESLNRTTLVYAPESRIKYSNAAIAVVGRVLEQVQTEPFARCLERTLLVPLGMKRSSFEPRPELMKDRAQAIMWSYHGRMFPAPTFELGTPPAGSMYSTVNDLGRFLGVLFAGGRGPGGQVLKATSLEQMWTPQFAKPGDKTGFGLGFIVSESAGKRRLGHGGAIYGYAAELAALPDDKLGVVVVASKDCANAVTTRIANLALSLMLAARQGKPLPAIEETTALPEGRARALAGRYQVGDKGFDLVERGERLWFWPLPGGFRAEVRALGDTLVTDDTLEVGRKLVPDGNELGIGQDTYRRVEVGKPAPLPVKWAGLIGEYGFEHMPLVILEKDGKLHALIEWFFHYPLTEVSENVFAFPDHGLYHGEKVVFTRNGSGQATRAEAAGLAFERRRFSGDNGSTFRIEPIRALDALRHEAIAAKPPEETGRLGTPDLVDVTTLDGSIKLDVRYATTNNFLGTPFYTSAKAFLQRPAAEALVRVHRKLAADGHGLLIHDAYRPWYVTKMFWDATPEHYHHFVANPANGSRHNRGCAVDLTLYDRASGKAVDMVSGYDEFSDRAYPEYPGGTSLQRWHRERLERAMAAEGFTVYEAEWWHFDYKDWRKYPILNRTFEQVR